MYPENFVSRLPGRYDADAVSLAGGTDFPHVEHPDWSLTVQSEKDDADINTIVNRFGITGTMPEARVPAEYGDFSSVYDFKSAMDELVRSEQLFMDLPASLRERFQNSASNFLEFVQDDANYDEAVKLKLVPPRPPLPPVEPPVLEGTSPPADS